MENEYSWNGGRGGSSSFRLPKSEGQGKWILIAIFLAVLAHAGILIGLSRINIELPEFVEKKEIRTQVVRVNPVDTSDSQPEVTAPDQPEIEEPVAVVPPADELEVLENLPEMEIDITPDVETIQVPKISTAAIGALEGESKEPMKATAFDPELPEMGETDDFFPRADDTQVTVDPGGRMAEEYDPDAYTDQLRKGAAGESEDGLLEGFTSLDQMAHMDGNSLLTTKALIGSDLLFEFNSAELKQSARVSLMKVALLIHKHPNLVCWLDGHTDLIGGEESNIKLSKERAMAVRSWLINSMELSEDRIAVRGFGKSQPIVKQGGKEAQAPNRRVEIKMRKGQPSKTVESAPKPKKVIIVEDSQPPKAVVAPEEPATNKALIIPEDEEPPVPRRVIPVPEEG